MSWMNHKYILKIRKILSKMNKQCNYANKFEKILLSVSPYNLMNSTIKYQFYSWSLSMKPFTTKKCCKLLHSYNGYLLFSGVIVKKSEILWNGLNWLFYLKIEINFLSDIWQWMLERMEKKILLTLSRLQAFVSNVKQMCKVARLGLGKLFLINFSWFRWTNFVRINISITN